MNLKKTNIKKCFALFYGARFVRSITVFLILFSFKLRAFNPCSNGEAQEICCALYAVGLHAAFDAVIDTGGECFWPKTGFKAETFGTDTGYGVLSCETACFYLDCLDVSLHS